MARRSLHPRLDDPVLYQTGVHWFVFVPSAVLLMIGLAFTGEDDGITSHVIGSIALFVSALTGITAFAMKASVSVRISSGGIVIKRGFLRADVSEYDVSTLGHVNISQSLFGRLFNYGTVILSVDGQSPISIALLRQPLEFRRSVTAAISSHREDLGKVASP